MSTNTQSSGPAPEDLAEDEPTTSHQASQTDRHSKRTKITEACEECRARKVRCDGAHPVCGACKRRRNHAITKCIYHSDKTNLISPDYVARLEKRIRQLEPAAENDSAPWLSFLRNDQTPTLEGNALLQRSLERHSTEPSPGWPYVQDSVQTSGSNRTDGRMLRQSTVPAASQHAQNFHVPLTPSRGVDAMGNIETVDNSYAEGSSSAASFVNQIREAVTSRLSLSRQQSIYTPWKDMGMHQPRHSIAEIYVLPSRRAADQMLNVYWNEVHVLYPFIHRPTFMHTYHDIWKGLREDEGEHVTYCILNIIFAITCQLHKRFSPEEKSVDGQVYFHRATRLLQLDVIANGSLELIQALLLMGQYLQGTELPHSCWMVIGLAIRTAQGLGLHLPATSANLEKQQDREMVRRLWHGCVFMDRMVSMTFGRPIVITRADAMSVPLPASVDDEYLAQEGGSNNTQPSGKPSTVEFWLQTLKLYFIQEQTLSAMYTHDRDKLQAVINAEDRAERLDFNAILEINSSLREWNDALPQELQIHSHPTPGIVGPIFARQANILHLRYLHVQILLLRPILSLLLAKEMRTNLAFPSSRGPSLFQSVALLCARDCISCAQNMINFIHQRQALTDNPDVVESLPAWWFKTFFTYTAATVLIPARMYSHIRGEISSDSLSEAWQRALEVLRSIAFLSSTAQRCLTVLQHLEEEMVSTNGSGTFPGTDVAGLTGNENGRNIAVSPHEPAISANPALPESQQSLPFMGDTVSRSRVSAPLPVSRNDPLGIESLMLTDDSLSWFDSLPSDLLVIENDQFL